MEDDRTPDTTPRRSRGMKVTIALGVATGLAVGATAIAGAVTTPDATSPVDPPAGAVLRAQTQAGPADGARVHVLGPGGRHKGPRPGMGLGMGIHGEFVVPAPGGGYQTMASQAGDVTDVSATSIKVKSEDGYEKTYVVSDDTVVAAGDNGIGDVKVGDKVHVLAVVTGDTAKAVDIRDRTAVGERHEKWGQKRPEKQAPASPPTTVS